MGRRGKRDRKGQLENKDIKTSVLTKSIGKNEKENNANSKHIFPLVGDLQHTKHSMVSPLES